ncbi:MAG: hypothetical protein ACLPYB_08190 [Desulfobaccales bacterium]
MDHSFADRLQDILEQAWFAMKAEGVSGTVTLAAVSVALVILFWFVFSPGIKNK